VSFMAFVLGISAGAAGKISIGVVLGFLFLALVLIINSKPPSVSKSDTYRARKDAMAHTHDDEWAKLDVQPLDTSAGDSASGKAGDNAAAASAVQTATTVTEKIDAVTPNAAALLTFDPVRIRKRDALKNVYRGVKKRLKKVTTIVTTSWQAAEMADEEQQADALDALESRSSDEPKVVAAPAALKSEPLLVNADVEDKVGALDAVNGAPMMIIPALPEVPGMAEANLTVSAECDSQEVEPTSQQPGASVLMEQDSGTILASMAQDGWEVKPVDGTTDQFEIFLPSVDFGLPMGSVSIPQPRFLTTIYDTYRTTEDGEERLTGDLVLMNGDDILTVSLGWTTLKLSAAGLARAHIGRHADAVYLRADVDIGMRIPKVPGLTKIMQLFVKSYANKSTFDCATALAKGADKIYKGAVSTEQTAWAVGIAATAVAAVESEAVAGLVAEAGQLLAGSAGSAGEVLSTVPRVLEAVG